MKDYRIKVTIRNDRLLSTMEEAGYISVAQFTKAHGLDYQRTSEIFNGKLKPVNKKGELTPLTKEILAILDLSVQKAFTERQLKGFLQTTFEKRVKEKDLIKIASPVKNHELLMMEKDVDKILNEILSELPPRYEAITRYINGIGIEAAHTLTETALKYSLSLERTRQIYKKALLKLSQAKNLEKLKNAGLRDVYGLFKIKTKKPEQKVML